MFLKFLQKYKAFFKVFYVLKQSFLYLFYLKKLLSQKMRKKIPNRILEILTYREKLLKDTTKVAPTLVVLVHLIRVLL